MLGVIDEVVGDHVPRASRRAYDHPRVKSIKYVVLDQVIRRVVVNIDPVTMIGIESGSMVKNGIPDLVTAGRPLYLDVLLGDVMAFHVPDPTMDAVGHDDATAFSVPVGRRNVEILDPRILDRPVR